MRIVVVLMAAFTVSGGLAQDFDGNDVQFAQQKKPTGYTGGGNAACQVIGEVRAVPASNATTRRLANRRCSAKPRQSRNCPTR